MNRSRFRSNADPPVSTIPVSIRSALSSGGACSSASRIAPIMRSSGAEIASRTSQPRTVTSRGMPPVAQRPFTRQSKLSVHGNRGPYLDFEPLGRRLADDELVGGPYVRRDSGIHIVSGNAGRARVDAIPERDHGYVRYTGSDIDHQAATGFLHPHPRSPGRGEGLIDEQYIDRSSVLDRFNDSEALPLCHPARDSNGDLEAVQRPGDMSFAQEAVQHAVEQLEIVDDSGANGPRGLKLARCPAAACFRFAAHRLNVTRTRPHCHQGRFIHGHPAAFHVYQRVSRPRIETNSCGKKADHSLSPKRGRNGAGWLALSLR